MFTHRSGDRVYLGCDPALRGTVTRVRDGRFTVAYDSARDGTRRVPGGRYSYPLSRMAVFLPGNPE